MGLAEIYAQSCRIKGVTGKVAQTKELYPGCQKTIDYGRRRRYRARDNCPVQRIAVIAVEVGKNIGVAGQGTKFRIVKEHIFLAQWARRGERHQMLRLTGLVYPGGSRVARRIVTVEKRK